MPLILGTNSIKDTGFNVSNSLRFNSASSDYLYQTHGTPTNAKKYTISTWLKTSTLGSSQRYLGYNGGSDWFVVGATGANKITYTEVLSDTTIGSLTPTAVSRDTSAWLNIVIAYDSTQGTEANRVKYYSNGVQITSFSASTYPSQNQDSYINSGNPFLLGAYGTNGSPEQLFNGYLSEFVFIDGTAYDQTSFGEFDEDSGIWKPIDVSELTFGNNGFYLDFQNSGSLGADVSGNGNNFTVNNLTSVDQSTDTCTNNFATFNSNLTDQSTYSEGNLKSTQNSGTNYVNSFSTIAVSSGKWYVEFKATAVVSNFPGFGIIDVSQIGFQDSDNNSYPGTSTNPLGVMLFAGGFYQKGNGTSETLSGVSYSSGNIISIALDLDSSTNNIKFFKNGTEISGSSITPPNVDEGYVFGCSHNMSVSGLVADANFGSPPYSISSGNSDGNGYGNFEYAVPSGYYALNTKNLAEYG